MGALEDAEKLISSIEARLEKRDADLAAVERDVAAFLQDLATRPTFTYDVRRGIDVYGTLVCKHETAGNLDEMNRLFALWQKLVAETDARDWRRFNFHPWHDYAIHLTGKKRKAAFKTALAGTRARIVAENEFAKTASREFKQRAKHKAAQASYYAAVFATELGELEDAVWHLRQAAKYDPSYLALAKKDEELKPLKPLLAPKKK